jgi:toxin ParE1/3/4
MRIRWTPAAADDLEHIAAYLKADHPDYARATVHEQYEAIRSLRLSPLLSRLGREPGTRELVFDRLPYVVVYRVNEDTIEVLRIWHGAQNR